MRLSEAVRKSLARETAVCNSLASRSAHKPEAHRPQYKLILILVTTAYFPRNRGLKNARRSRCFKGKHNEKSGPILCHYLVAICACIPPEKKLTSKNLLPWRYGQLRTLLLITSCCGRGFVMTQIGEPNSCLG